MLEYVWKWRCSKYQYVKRIFLGKFRILTFLYENFPTTSIVCFYQIKWSILPWSYKLTFSSKLDRGSYVISIAKTASKKIVALIRSMKFLSPEVTLYLYKSTIRPCMEYYCHVWAGAPICYLELLNKLQKRLCRTISPSLAASLEPLAHFRNVASLSLFYRY